MSRLRRLIRHPHLWLAAFLLWAGVLWWLSSSAREFPTELDFRASDKVLHFGYFFGGAGLLSAFWFRLRGGSLPPWKKHLLGVTLAVGLIGVLDEWHQSWVPNRFGNDPGDLAADIAGAFCGALVFRRCHRLIA